MGRERATPAREPRVERVLTRAGGFRTISLMAVAMLTGCFYISKGEFDDAWDRDGDGFPNDEDCAPDDPRIYPGAPDPRGDGCDSDCGVEPDADGDDWPDDNDCYGGTDPTIYPCAPDAPGDEVDSDCDGYPDPRPAEDVCLGIDPRDPAAERFDGTCDHPATGVTG